MSDPIAEYQKRYESFLKKVAANLQVHLESYLVGLPHFDRVAARAKNPNVPATAAT